MSDFVKSARAYCEAKDAARRLQSMMRERPCEAVRRHDSHGMPIEDGTLCWKAVTAVGPEVVEKMPMADYCQACQRNEVLAVELRKQRARLGTLASAMMRAFRREAVSGLVVTYADIDKVMRAALEPTPRQIERVVSGALEVSDG